MMSTELPWSKKTRHTSKFAIWAQTSHWGIHPGVPPCIILLGCNFLDMCRGWNSWNILLWSTPRIFSSQTRPSFCFLCRLIWPLPRGSFPMGCVWPYRWGMLPHRGHKIPRGWWSSMPRVWTRLLSQYSFWDSWFSWASGWASSFFLVNCFRCLPNHDLYDVL